MSSKKSQKKGSKKDKSSKKGKEKEKAAKSEVAVAEPVPFFLYYFCCFCLLPKKFRKDKRRLEREKKAQLESAEDSELVDEDKVVTTKVDPKAAAATKIQAMVRGYQAKEAMKEYWEYALHEVSQYWLQIARARELAWLEKERAIVARKQFVFRYVQDIFETSLAFLSQTSQASTEIQRVWRGHRTRKKIVPKPPPRPQKPYRRPIPKVIPRPRHTVDTLRRVWSRRDFEPAKGKWLHTTDFGHLDYDMWEYVDQPPKGSDHGLRVHKVHAVARNEHEKEALTRDKHAWVGLPVGLETPEELRLREKQTIPDNVVRLKSKSPYNAPVVNWDKMNAGAEEIKRKQKEEESRMTKKKKKGKKGKRREKGLDSSGLSSGSDDYETSNSEREETKRTAFEVHDGALVAKEEDEEATLLSGSLDESKFVRALKKFGYDPNTMDPTAQRGLPRIGTEMYDLHTGRRIVHKGDNRWVGVHDKSFVVQYEMPAQTLAFDEAVEIQNGRGDQSVDRFGEYSLVTLRPKIQHHRSGAVTVVNPALLNKKSRFLREHRSLFLDNFTHHNLSEYSGLLSSTYFDLTVHAQNNRQLQGGSIGGSTVEDDITDFNYIQSSPTQPRQKGLGFQQSFLTEAAVSLAKSHAESRLYPLSAGMGLNTASTMTTGSNVRFTAAGVPIRGARKPHASGPTLLSGASERPSELGRKYTEITESYGSQPGSRFTSAKYSAYSAKGSQKSALSVQSSGAVSTAVSSKDSKQSEIQWQSSKWGKLKKGVERLAAIAASDPAIKNNLYRAVTNGSIASSSLGNGYDAEELDFASARRDQESAQQEEEDLDSDEEMWRSRSAYKVSKEAAVKVGVWPRKPKPHYKLRYTWIPQPLVHNAANNIYYEKTVSEHRQHVATVNAVDFKTEIKQSKEKYQKKLEKSSMLSIVADSSREAPGMPQRKSLRSVRTSEDLSPGGGAYSPLSGAQSPSGSSVASSKYYNNFIDDRDAAGGSSKVYRGSSKVGLGSGVMITAMLDGDSSIGSDSDGSYSASPNATSRRVDAESQRKMLKKGSNLSYTLHSDDGRTAQYEVQSNNGSVSGSPSSKSPGKIAPFSPGKGLAEAGSRFNFPSPSASYGNVQPLVVQPGMEPDDQSAWSSPQASGPTSVAGSGAWDATGGTPTGTFYSAKSSSKSASKLAAHDESDAEFAHAFDPSASYLAHRPAELKSTPHKNVMFVEKDTTSAEELRGNHFLTRKQRHTIQEQHEASTGHVVLRPPPPQASPTKNPGTYAPKFKFKPAPTRSSSFVAAEAGSTVSRIARPPPPSAPPPTALPSTSVKSGRLSSPPKLVGNSSAKEGVLEKAGSSKRLDKNESIHPYSFF